MDADSSSDVSASTEDANAVEPKTEADSVDVLDGILSGGEVTRELETAGEVLTRVELDIARSSEKLVNLNILMMHVATKESEFEALVSEEEHDFSGFVEKALEFDFLSGILDSEVIELDNILSTLKADILNTRETISSSKHLGEAFRPFRVMEEKLNDSEESLKESLEQISEIRVQAANFQRILWKDNSVELLENGDSSQMNSKIKMQTAEQQRQILRMLEKSLARELDLEKKMIESTHVEEGLKLRLHQEVFCIEEEAMVAWERLFEADNIAEVLLGTSKELMGRVQMLQFHLNGSVQREGELRSQHHDYVEQLKAKDRALQKLENSSVERNEFFLSQESTLKSSLREVEDKLVIADSEAFTLREKVSSLEKQLEESESQLLKEKALRDENQELCSKFHEPGSTVEDLKSELSRCKSRAENAEAKCNSLEETNMELNKELSLLKSKGITSDRADSLERQLRESDIQLHHAVASVEASQEKQTMLYSTIKDMENLIKDLKLKVSKAENHAESAEDKCIILSESNSDLNEELSFLRGRMECLEASLHQAEETKKATAKDIGVRTEVIAGLVVQLALERERLQKQISSLRKEKKILVKHLQQTTNELGASMSHDGKGNSNDYMHSKLAFSTVTCEKDSKGAAEFLATSSEPEKMPKDVPLGEPGIGLADSTAKLETTRNIDITQLRSKKLFLFILMVAVPLLVGFWLQHSCGQL